MKGKKILVTVLIDRKTTKMRLVILKECLTYLKYLTQRYREKSPLKSTVGDPDEDRFYC